MSRPSAASLEAGHARPNDETTPPPTYSFRHRRGGGRSTPARIGLTTPPARGSTFHLNARLRAPCHGAPAVRAPIFADRHPRACGECNSPAQTPRGEKIHDGSSTDSAAIRRQDAVASRQVVGMKKLLILGVGAQGSTVAKRMDEEPNVSELIVADYDEKAVNDLAAQLTKAKPVQIDATKKENVVELAKGCRPDCKCASASLWKNGPGSRA